VRVLSLSLLLVMLLGCERELPYETPAEKPITGYQLEGYVTDRLGVPLRGVRVGVWYDYEFVDTLHTSIPSFFVDDSSKVARVQVLSRNKRIVDVLFDGRSNVGYLDYEWDKRDATGNFAPSGVYTVDFSMNGLSRQSYSVVVDGAVTAVTDSLGHYLISDENLPVGFYPVQRTNGSYRITPLIGLELYVDVHRGTSLTLVKDQVTRRDFII
jgi:hypothetical protein